MGTPQHTSAADVEATIRSLISVISAGVVTDNGGIIEEIHVLADSSRAPKQIVRDVESALMARFGLELDHKKVSVAQTQDGKQFRFGDGRLKVSDVSISLNGTKAQASVCLARNGDRYTGSVEGHSSTLNQLRLVATSTLRAVESCRGTEGALVLEDINPNVVLSGQNVVVVCINLITPRGEDFLTGSAIVKQDLWKAVVNATLDAVNRRMGSIL